MNKQAQMLSHITRWRSSGLSQQAYCKNAGLAYPTFRYWFLKSKASSGESAGFIPIVPDSPLPVRECIEVRYPNGVELRLPASCLSSLVELINCL